jgi:porin
MTFKSSADDPSDRNLNNNSELANFLDSWSKEDYFTGNWGGLREKLSDMGVNFYGYYETDILGNPLGGNRKGVQYSGVLDVFLDLDFGKLLHISGLKFRISGSWSSGRSLSARDIGNFFDVSNAFSGNAIRLYQLYIEQSLFRDKLNIAVGRIGTGDEFMTSPLFNNFVSLAFNQNPISIFFNIPSFTVDPFSTLGVRIKASPDKRFYTMIGAYNSSPAALRDSVRGLDFGFEKGALLIGELGYLPNQEGDSKGLPGTYKIGGYYDTGGFDDLSNADDELRGNYGLYLLMEQMVYREGGPESQQGLTPFATVTFAPKAEINTFPFFFSTGSVYRGLFPGRDDDNTSFGLAYGKFSKKLRNQDFEMAFELTHMFVVTPWLSIQPDLQFIVHPAGTGDIPNAFVLGIELIIDL